MSKKAQLRAAMRALRRRLAIEAPEAWRRLAAQLPDNVMPADAVVALYRPMGAEIDPSALARSGWTVVYPVVVDAHTPMIFREDETSPVLRPDVVFTPMIAFDRRGGRLGQGGGHYDRTLAALRASGPALVIGVAFAGQELPEIPVETHDQRLDAILTETGFTWVDKEAP